MKYKKYTYRILSAFVILSIVNVYSGALYSHASNHTSSNSCCHTIETESVCCNSSIVETPEICSSFQILSFDELKNCGCVLSDNDQLPFLVTEKISVEQNIYSTDMVYTKLIQKQHSGISEISNYNQKNLSNRNLLQRISTFLI